MSVENCGPSEATIEYFKQRGFTEEDIRFHGWYVAKIGDEWPRYGFPNSQAADVVAAFIPYPNGEAPYKRLRVLDTNDLDRIGDEKGKYRGQGGIPLQPYDPDGALDQAGDSIALIEGEWSSRAFKKLYPSVPVVGIAGQGGLSEDIAKRCGHFPYAYLHLDQQDKGFERSHVRWTERLLNAGVETVCLLDNPGPDDPNDILVKHGLEKGGEIVQGWFDRAKELTASTGDEGTEDKEDKPDGVFFTNAATVKPKPTEWCIEGRIPYGGLTLLVGQPGLGKSGLTCHWAAQVAKRHPVVMANAEDNRESTISPRLEAAGADLSRIHFANVRLNGVEGTISIPDHIEDIKRQMREIGARLLIIDPLMAHLPGEIDGHKDQSIRRALAPAHFLAEELACAVVVVAHLNKRQTSEIMSRVGGSIGLQGAVRSALLLARESNDSDEDDGKRVLAHFKCNVGPELSSLAYEIQPETIHDPEGNPIPTFQLEEIGESGLRHDELLEAPSSDERSKLAEAIDFLYEVFEAGSDNPRTEVKTKDVQNEARQLDIGHGTLSRARRTLGITPDRQGGIGGSGEWYLLAPKDGFPKKPTPSVTKGPTAGVTKGPTEDGQIVDSASESQKDAQNNPPKPLTDQSLSHGQLGAQTTFAPASNGPVPAAPATAPETPYDELTAEEKRTVDLYAGEPATEGSEGWAD